MDCSTRAIDCTNNYFTSSKVRRPVFGRQSIRYSRARCTPGVDAYTEIQSDVGCCCDTPGEPCSKHHSLVRTWYYKLFNSTLSEHRYHIITHFIIIIHHYNRHHSFKPSLPSSLLSRTINIMIIIIIIIAQIIIMLSSFIISSSLFTNVIIITLSYHQYDNHYL